MKVLFILTIFATTASAEQNLRALYDQASQDWQLCLDTCRNGNVGEGITPDNVHPVCKVANSKFHKNYEDCRTEMQAAFDSGESDAIDVFCEWVCPYTNFAGDFTSN
mmetsp:Transcript_14229/g.21035  ORF Transcript_14229/g.21035 Transcript_14229/m.21035 type:complete len:107 (-) Transcript_14229:494-814(-)|eukprot:CAMPEP_0194209602 /NCGR_PEP_ID=MMETSP0156-20130528/7673_1 /TAXON_ID=33649 /ORGANISM="Thalassionema nitzschioides, Strain L26-B" /LENGTH=106 /DNA_ID=CAMNT_0038936801 /DNA_START=86 /DNA_END=406 /DNA_ORIENTATION=+